MSLSSWLRDYLYISLGGNRKGKIRTYVNLFLTMLLGGLWHGAAFRFILWGALHGLALGLHKFVLSFKWPQVQNSFLKNSSNVFSIFITFHFVCFCWIFFRAQDMETAGQVITQIATHFSPGIFFDFIMGYKAVLLLMVLGYILHFIPAPVEQRAENWVTSLSLTGKFVVIFITILIVIQTKSAGIQPFIYFQF